MQNVHQSSVKKFMKAMGQQTPESFSPETFPYDLRSKLIVEEANEFKEACEKKDHVEIIDAICDLLYVTYGAAIALGIDIDPFFNEVHRSNMSKLDPETGKPIVRHDGKILKPSTYSPPDISCVLEDYIGK
ncbi:MAG: phosphoribosyl-ATP diphosphatase [Bacteroidetes bacterium]|nr:phosphoribosyl-ATP diphosphatase [Bacteroidota bacterium]